MGNDSVIFIRTDGNLQIATGHLVRCLSIARAIEKEKKKVIFLLSDEESSSLLTELSSSLFGSTFFPDKTVILPGAKFNHLEEELPFLTSLLTKYQRPVLLVDSYSVTEQYFTALKPYARIAYLDDLRSFDYGVDLVINYDVIPPSKQAEYEAAYTNASKCLLGAGYTPLRPQFQNQLYHVREEIQDILITTGGSDPYDFCQKISSLLLPQKENLTIHLVIGRLFSQDTINTLKEISQKDSRMQLYQSVSDMASLMKQCDFAISAAGTTLYELCAIGVPAISITMTDNQLIMAETFSETKALPYAGDLRENFDTTVENILNLLQNLSSSSARKQLYTKMKSLVGTKGAEKIAKALCHLS